MLASGNLAKTRVLTSFVNYIRTYMFSVQHFQLNLHLPKDRPVVRPLRRISSAVTSPMARARRRVTKFRCQKEPP